MPPNKDNLIWLDLEMTGLFPETDTILEIATIVTDGRLRVLAEGPVIAVHQPDEVLEAMDAWNTKTHGESGLTERVRQSHYSMADAEQETIAFLKQWVNERCSPLCGNSICQDRRFMARLMPELEDFFHYRNLDVSTIKELACRWAPEVANGFKKDNEHIALADIKESIAELKYYCETAFIKSP